MKKILIMLFLLGIFACGEQQKPEQTDEAAVEEVATEAMETMEADSTVEMEEEEAPE